MIELKAFSDINLSDTFFDSLKEDYDGFSEWFNRKATANEAAYTLTDVSLEAFLYLKIEENEITDITPPLPAKRRMKIGTMKINPHGTRLGERFIKVAFNNALKHNVNEIYVTIFEHHEALVNLFNEFGFIKIGEKRTEDGVELVLLKDLEQRHHCICKDFPVFDTSPNKYLLSIYPSFHSILFPDSILTTENAEDIIMDISHTNSIHKIYICKMQGVENIQRGDNIVIYRTKPSNQNSAWFHSVATTVCVAEEVKTKADFDSIDEYLEYCNSYSIFNESELRRFYGWNNLIVIKFLYNASFTKRVNMQKLVEDAGLSRTDYWGFRQLSDDEYFNILNLGQVDRRLIR